MKKILIFVMLSLISLTAKAAIEVELSPSKISLDSPFRVILTQKDPQNGNALPNLTELKKDFEILGTERQMSYSIINGQSQSAYQWMITLKAKKAGVLTLPSIQVGADRTDPITINVEEEPFQTQEFSPSQIKDVMLTTEVSTKKPYVNQQVLYTVKLYYSKRLLDADYQEAQVEDALFVPLGEAKRYQTLINDINYVVQEQNYAIFPQKSGSLTIKSPKFKALVFGLNPTTTRVENKPITLTVEPEPKDYKGKTWLPAKDIKLSQQYEHNNQSINQGNTLIRTIKLEAKGIPAQLFPKLAFEENEAYSVYPEYGKEKTEVKQGELVGSVDIKVTYLFKKPGQITLPAVKLPWFNTDTKKEEEAVLPPRTLDIVPAVVEEQKAQAMAPPASKLPEQTPSTPTTTAHWSWLLAAIFATAWVLTLGLWLWQKRRSPSSKGAYTKALAALKEACSQCNPLEAREALLKWASLHWPDAPILNLTDITKLTRDPQFKKQIHLLSEILYKKDDRMLWRGDELLKCVLAEKKVGISRQGKSQVLPPIHPM